MPDIPAAASDKIDSEVSELMETIAPAAISVLLLAIVLCVVGLIRNQWVYKMQDQIIEQISADCRKYIDKMYNDGRIAEVDVTAFYETRKNEYLSYNEMMSPLRWHIWKLEGLRRRI